MTDRVSVALAVCLGLTVAAIGVAYAFVHTSDWQSEAALVITPDLPEGGDVSGLMQSFDDSGVNGTRVEMVLADDILTAAGSPQVTIAARAVPDTRVLEITTNGEQSEVRAGLAAVVDAALLADKQLGDNWRLQVLESPGVAAEAGPSRGVLAGTSLLLGILVTIATAVGAARLLPMPPRESRALTGVPAHHHPAEVQRAESRPASTV